LWFVANGGAETGDGCDDTEGKGCETKDPPDTCVFMTKWRWEATECCQTGVEHSWQDGICDEIQCCDNGVGQPDGSSMQPVGYGGTNYFTWSPTGGIENTYIYNDPDEISEPDSARYSYVWRSKASNCQEAGEGEGHGDTEAHFGPFQIKCKNAGSDWPLKGEFTYHRTFYPGHGDCAACEQQQQR
jgi:hypothetical protein